MSTPEIQNYVVAQVLWDKFGIPAYMLHKIDARWVEEVLTISAGESKAQTAKNKEK